jgi:hypothetical protein
MLAAATLLVGGCDRSIDTEPPATSPASPQLAEARSGLYLLTLSAPPLARAGIPIPVTGSLKIGNTQAINLFTPGSGPILFSLAEVDGTVRVEPGGPANCVSQTYRPDEIYSTPFIKTGAFAPGQPDSDFFELYYQGRDLILPAGQWDIGAHLYASPVDCGQVAELTRATLRITVVP